MTEINYVAPIYWAVEMVARDGGVQRYMPRASSDGVPTEEVQGAIIFIGSVASQGNKGQIAYASAKAGLEGAAATLMKEAIFHGVRCSVIHPGFTDTPILRDLGEEYVRDHVLRKPSWDADSTPGNRRCNLLHDHQSGGQRGPVGGRGLASGRGLSISV